MNEILRLEGTDSHGNAVVRDVTVPLSKTCTSPVFSTSTLTGIQLGKYYIRNHFNSGAQTMSVCSPDNWHVDARQPNGTAVRAYPNVQRNYTNPMKPVADFTTLTSRFAMTAPRCVGCIWNVGYDVWINGISTPNYIELMIWTENHGQRPKGSIVEAATFAGRTYDVWRGADNHYIAFVSRVQQSSGTMPLLDIIHWGQGRGWINADATIRQIGFGVEIVDTNDAVTRFAVTDFAVTES